MIKTTYICDICGKTLSDITEVVSFEFKFMPGACGKKELCPDCAREIYNYLRNKFEKKSEGENGGRDKC